MKKNTLKATTKLFAVLLALFLVIGMITSCANISYDDDNNNKEETNITTSIIKVESVEIKKNATTVEVRLSILNNPGLTLLKLFVDYDDTKMTLTDVAFNSDFDGYWEAPKPYSSHQSIALMSPNTMSKNGSFATLTFDILNATENMDIRVSIDTDNTFNADGENISLDTVDGKITIQ